MITIPPAPDVLGRPSPVVGSPTEAFAGARTLTSLSDDLLDARTQLTRAEAELLNLSGEGVRALMLQIQEHLQPAIDQMLTEAQALQDGLARYGDAVEDVHEQAHRMTKRCEAALEGIRDCALRLERAALSLGVPGACPTEWSTAPPVVPPTPSDFCVAPEALMSAEQDVARLEWATQAMQWHEYLHSIHSCQEQWRELVRERRRIETQLRDTFTTQKLFIAYSRSRTGRSSLTRLATVLTGKPGLVAGKSSDPQLETLLSGLLPPREVARRWVAHPLHETWRRDLPRLSPTMWFRIANTPGIPATVQDCAARLALAHALRNPGEAYEIMGFAGSTLSRSQFAQQLTSLSKDIAEAQELSSGLRIPQQVLLLGLGNHDDRLTAALAVGNPDHAQYVGVNVSGMFSQVKNMGDTFPGVVNLVAEAQARSPEKDTAVIHWIGYRSPGLLPGEHHVLGMRDAQSGGARLADFLDGIVETRLATGEGTTQRRTALGHSYGSTTTTEALKLIEHPVDAYATYGSAGVHLSSGERIAARELYSTTARGDQIAGLGILGSGRIDPQNIDEVRVFSSEKGEQTQRVTAHTMYGDENASTFANPQLRGYLSAGTESLRRMGALIVGTHE